MTEKNLTLAVHLHLYYRNMWEELCGLLHNMDGYPYDLYVTMVEKDLSLMEKIKEFKPDAKIKIVENRGYDIGPFVDFLHDIDLDKYDLVMKLHTKSKNKGAKTNINRRIFNRKLWAETLINSLIGSTKQFEKNINAFKTDNLLGMVGSRYLITSDSKCIKTVQAETEKVLEALGHHATPIKFVAGTMFICRSQLLKEVKDHYTITDFEPTDGLVKDKTLAHVLERVLGSLVIANGYQMQGFDYSYLKDIRLLCEDVFRFVYQSKITANHYKVVKICKLPVYHRRFYNGENDA